jgi:tetratricopeptide (TPR) repeat protein
MPARHDAGAPDAGPPEATVEGIARASVEAALSRVLNSRAFAASPQSSAFLEYAARETLAGRGDQLTERSVGRKALGRPALFDGRSDSGVRVQGSRVRKSLIAYYEDEGATEPVRVVLPPGGYAVSFEHADSVDDDEDPVVLVAVPRALDDSAAAAAAATGVALVHALTGFPGLTVVGSQQLDGDLLAEGRARRAGYVLTGTAITVDDGTRVLLQLMETRRAATLWTREHALGDCAGSLDAWAMSVAAEVGDYTGIVLRNEVARGTGTSLTGSAKRAFYSFVQTEDLDELQRASELLGQVIAEGGGDPLVLSMRAGMCSVAAACGLVDDSAEALATAESLGREVLALDPTSGQAHVALGIVALVRGDLTMVRNHADLAVRCWPHHPSTLLSAASLLSSARDWTAAADTMRKALELTSLLPGYAWTVIAVERLLADDDEVALVAASHIHAPGFPWGPLYRALAYDGLGRHDRAREEMAQALAVEPRLVERPEEFLEAVWSWDLEHLERLLSRFERYRQAEATAVIPVPRDDASQPVAHESSHRDA